MNSNLIKDMATREAVKKLEDKLRKIENIKQLPQDASLEEVIKAVNKISDSLKRR